MRKGQKSSRSENVGSTHLVPLKVLEESPALACQVEITTDPLTNTEDIKTTPPASVPFNLLDVRRAQAFLLVRDTHATRREAAFISLYG